MIVSDSKNIYSTSEKNLVGVYIGREKQTYSSRFYETIIEGMYHFQPEYMAEITGVQFYLPVPNDFPNDLAVLLNDLLTMVLIVVDLVLKFSPRTVHICT